MADKTKALHTYHSAARGELLWFCLPILLLPLAVFGLVWWDGTTDGAGQEREVVWWAYLVTVLVLLLPPLVLRLRAQLTTKYTISLDSVMAVRGFFSRHSSEVRIANIRAINVDQTFLDRLFGIGDVSFSSSARDAAEVIFQRVPQPNEVRRLVREIQDRTGAPAALSTDDGVLKTPQQKAEAVAARDAASTDTATRGELEALLEQTEQAEKAEAVEAVESAPTSRGQ